MAQLRMARLPRGAFEDRAHRGGLHGRLRRRGIQGARAFEAEIRLSDGQMLLFLPRSMLWSAALDMINGKVSKTLSHLVEALEIATELRMPMDVGLAHRFLAVHPAEARSVRCCFTASVDPDNEDECARCLSTPLPSNAGTGWTTGKWRRAPESGGATTSRLRGRRCLHTADIRSPATRPRQDELPRLPRHRVLQPSAGPEVAQERIRWVCGGDTLSRRAATAWVTVLQLGIDVRGRCLAACAVDLYAAASA
jgi:hypothetical protein